MREKRENNTKNKVKCILKKFERVEYTHLEIKRNKEKKNKFRKGKRNHREMIQKRD